MNLLTSLISISIFILSVAKTTDLFILADKKLNHVQQKFIEETRKMHRNENGNFTLLAAIVTVALSGLLLFFVTKMKIEYKEAVYRKESYLCLEYLNHETKTYIDHMSSFNIALRAAFASMILTEGATKDLWDALKMARNIRHLSYMKNLVSNRYCDKSQALSYVKNTPYKLTPYLMLLTTFDETAVLRKNEWAAFTYKIPRNIRLNKSFCLKSVFKMESAFSKKVEIQTQELASLNLKCFSGQSS